MLKLLPAPVWPYANKVELYPSNAEFSTSWPMSLNTIRCVAYWAESAISSPSGPSWKPSCDQ